ncbi:MULTISPECIES: ParB family protein [Pseudomonas putida group]|uniref:Chromosome partitioning protein ParB n=2 Tax=Pseudomonas TaxID=286 RepID=A0A2S3WND2_PSEPU|nr:MULTISPECIES: ParB family protein [Pseudomonas putida group]MBA6136280.1 ParB family protein [Pseudomonas monteilii]POG02891.1 chromosome partitioning protein ParB [Pseudomonas putida]
MKPPTSDDITRKLQHGHFPQRATQVSPTDPDCDTPMVVTLEQLRPYEHNPRFIRNPLYEELKASIRDRGLDQPPSITRRPGEPQFIIRNGGNTRLSILGELWQETRDDRFFRIDCLFRPWQSELHTLLGHLAESDLHGQLTFIERALAVAKFRDMLLVDGGSLSQRELAAQLSAGGYPISQSHISRMLDTLEHLLPAIPQTLYAGLGRPSIERTLNLRRRAESVWNRYVATRLDFTALWLEVLSTFDCTAAELDTAELQDELLAHMAKSLDQSPRLLALELFQDSGQASRQPLTPDRSLPSPQGVGQDTDTTSGSEPEAPTGLHSPELVCPPQPADRQPEQADLKQPPAVTREQVRTPTAPPPAQSANLGNAGLQSSPGSLDTIWPIPPALEDLVRLRQACAQLASELAGYANAPHMVCATEEGLGFSLAPDTAAPSTPHRTGIQLLLGALLRVQDDVAWEQRQQLPAALFGQLLLGVYDLPLIERPALAIGIERLPDPQLAQLFSLIRLSRRLIELTLSSTR